MSPQEVIFKPFATRTWPHGGPVHLPNSIITDLDQVLSDLSPIASSLEVLPTHWCCLKNHILHTGMEVINICFEGKPLLQLRTTP